MLTPLLAFLASLLIRFLRWTWRVEICGAHPPPTDRPIVFAFWHGHQSAMFAYPHTRRTAVLSSLSKDGALQARILRHMGFAVRRGSSSRGGAAGLKGIVEEMRNGCDAAFAVDGPKGPLHQVKPGAIEAARAVNGRIVPMISTASRVWVFEKAWDRYTLPKPFAKVTIQVGEALSTEASPETLAERLHR